MAGEKKGEAFECLICLALQDLGYKLGHNLFWGEKPVGFSIDPDLILGKLDSPTHWLMATSSGSAKNSLEKFWRNLGELFEAKRSFSNPPKVINLVFETNLRDALQQAMSAIADSELLVAHHNYGEDLQIFIDKVVQKIPNSREEKLIYIKTKLSSDLKAGQAYKAFTDSLQQVIQQSKPEFSSLWLMLRSEKRNPSYREARKTYFRRGIAKIMTLSQETRQPLYEHILNRKNLGKLPEHFYRLGYASKSLVGSVISDAEIIWVVKNLQIESLEYVINQSYLSRPDNWRNWINILHNTEVSKHQSYIEENYDTLTTPDGMLWHFRSHNPTGYKWLFTHLMEILKLFSGKRQGYGYSVLSRDVGYTTGISQGYLELSDWVNGFIESPRASNLLPDVSRVLANRLEKIPLSKLKEIGLKIEGEYYRNLMETKIISYWLFEPLPLLIRKALKDSGWNPQDVKKHPTFIGEYLMQPTKIASPHVIRVSRTLISWRSAYDLGKHHKTKELAGRGQALRYEFENGIFQKREDITRMILVIDGTFTEGQLKALFDSGWDEIIYADEIEKLAELII